MNLARLLASLEPSLDPTTWCFVTADTADVMLPCTREALMSFREPEGITFILPAAVTEEHQLRAAFVCRMITLTVHSDLAAVGLMAHVSTELSKHGICCNAVSGYE